MSRRKKGKKSGAFASHQRRGSQLLPPLAQGLPIKVFDFERDLLPEYLWIAALVAEHGIESAHKPYYRLLDALDTFWPKDEYPALGLLTDFAVLTAPSRQRFKEEHGGLIREAFHNPIGRPLAFYPEGPAYWLIDQEELSSTGPLDPDAELSRLSNIVFDLLPAKDEFAGHVRMMPLGRVLKHGKLFFPKNFDLAEVLPRYPHNCTDEEKWRVQSLGRMQINELHSRLDRYCSRTWPMYFWRHNYNLAPCTRLELPLRGAAPLSREAFDAAAAVLEYNATAAREYLDLLARQAPVDIYDPVRDEILLGLYARCVRLYTLMAEDPNLWARDTAGIMLRCLAETAITFGYLAKAGTPDDFQRFRDYGTGQEKLLMLHLEETHPDGKSLEGRSAADIRSDIGTLAPMLLQIELGSWSGKDLRKLAAACGMERLYRLVFSPSSGDVHGTWTSLQRSNLVHCGQPLHRFHRLPSFSEPPFFLNVMLEAQDLIETCTGIGIDVCGFPEMPKPLRHLEPSAQPDPT